MRKATWAPLDPETLAGYLDGTGIRWRLTGTSAFNNFLGYQLREPHDLDVQIVTDDVSQILFAMPSWQHYYVDCSAWLRWQGQPLADDIHRLVSRPARNEPWGVDWLLTTVDGDDWVYGYDDRVRSPWNATTDGGSAVSFAPPEVALLHKSRLLRPKDSADFEALVPHLDGRRRAWLADAISLSEPDHAWLRRLR